MSERIEEPLRYNFQADLLHSGSISFGRFESESLSWEKRSSFSHNRYLEEVEKYSRPGSVIEKKAYFEAHFRRKGLLKKSYSESHDSREIQTIENDNPQDLPESKNGNESKHFECFDEIPQYATSFHEGGEGLECEREEFGVFSVAPKNESRINTNDMVCGSEHLRLEETRQIGTESAVFVKSEGNTRESLDDMVVMVDVASDAKHSSLSSHTADKDDDRAISGTKQKFPSKVRPASEMKQPKTILKTHANVAHVQRIISIEASNGSAKAKTKESKCLLLKEKEKKSPRPVSPVAHSGRKTSKSEESSINFPKVKILPPSKSIVKEYRSERTMETKSSVLEKSLHGARLTVNRSKQNYVTPTKPHVNPGTTGFNFKSDQRADRKKQEKRTAESVQTQSLNFKATPMPSFYKESARSSDQNKVMSTSKTPNRPRTPCMTTCTNRVSSKFTSSSYSRPTSSPSLTTRNRPLEPSRKTHVPEKRVQEKGKERKQKEPGSTNTYTLRKETKAVQLVGVAT